MENFVGMVMVIILAYVITRWYYKSTEGKYFGTGEPSSKSEKSQTCVDNSSLLNRLGDLGLCLPAGRTIG